MGEYLAFKNVHNIANYKNFQKGNYHEELKENKNYLYVRAGN